MTVYFDFKDADESMSIYQFVCVYRAQTLKLMKKRKMTLRFFSIAQDEGGKQYIIEDSMYLSDMFIKTIKTCAPCCVFRRDTPLPVFRGSH